MQLELTREKGAVIARLMGELDHHTASPIRQQIDTAVLSCHCTRLTLDLSGLTFMDSSGIGLIMGRYRLMTSLGGTLLVQNCGKLERMIRLAGLERLPIWGNTNERSAPYETH